MAEIRANREYKFKEFCISEEIPKSPPLKTKRWTFHDPNSSSRSYNRPQQRKWEEKDPGQPIGSGDNNINQQYMKPFKKPESDLRAEFFNAYKKYYRRVDIKRLEVESTLNVDAKFTGADESLEGEGSLYKEKECMEINIVMDTEKDDALVSSKIRRTVLCGSPGEDGTRGIGSVRSEELIIGGPEEFASSENNMILGENMLDDSGYSSSHEKSNCLVLDFPFTSEKKYNGQGKRTSPRIGQGTCPISQKVIPFVDKSENSKNVESVSGKNLSEKIDQSSSPNSHNYVKKADFFVNDPAGKTPLVPTEMSEENSSTVFSVNKRDCFGQTMERTFFSSKMNPNSKEVHRAPSGFRNSEGKYSNSEILSNCKPKSNASISSVINNSDDSTMKCSIEEGNNAPLTFRNSSPKSFYKETLISQKVENNFLIDSNWDNADFFGRNSKVDEITTDQESFKTYKNGPISDKLCLEEDAKGSRKGPETNQNNDYQVFRIDSSQEPPGTSRDEISKTKSGVRFRGLRGPIFNKSNENNLKSVVVNVINNDGNYEKKVTRQEPNNFHESEQNNLQQRNENKDGSNLQRNNVQTCSEKSSRQLTTSQFSCSDPLNKSFNKVNVPTLFKNITPKSRRSADSEDSCSESMSVIFPKRETNELPFVVWRNQSKTDHFEPLQLKKLTLSDNESDIESEKNVNSDQRSFLDLYSVHETSNNDKKDLQTGRKDNLNYFISLENRKEKPNFKAISETSNQKKVYVNNEKGMQFPTVEFSNTTSIPSQKRAYPKNSSHNECSRYSEKISRENQKTEVVRERVIFDERGENLVEGSGVVSYKHNNATNSCLVGERQLTGRIAKNKHECIEESKRKANVLEENAERSIIKQYPAECVVEQSRNNYYESNVCDNKPPKAPSSDFLHIVPKYTFHEGPSNRGVSRMEQKNNYNENWEREDIGERCHGGQANRVNRHYCSHDSVIDCICRKQIETPPPRNIWEGSSPFCCENSSNTCREMVCLAYYKPNSDMKPCGYLNPRNDSCCDCEVFSRGFSHRMLDINDDCRCHVRDTNIHCNSCNCPKSKKHHRHVSCSCQNRNRNYCQKCGDEEMRFVINECSINKHNNLHCSSPCCSMDVRIAESCTRKGNCCNSFSNREQINSCPLRLDRERHKWMVIDHQALPNADKSPADNYMERYDESTNLCITEENDVSERGSRCPKNSVYHRDLNDGQEHLSLDNHRINNLYNHDKVVKNVQIDSSNSQVRSYPSRDITAKTTCLKNSVDSDGIRFNVTGWDTNFTNKEETDYQLAKLVPEKRVDDDQETKRFSRESENDNRCETRKEMERENRCETRTEMKREDRCETMMNGAAGLDGGSDNPLFLCEEQWDTDDGLPMRRVISKVGERKKENVENSGSDDEPIYLREENWGSGDEETGIDKVLPKNYFLNSARHRNGMRYLWRGQRSFERSAVPRSGNFPEEEESRICSSVHAVSDPSFHCEEQWASDEDKCEGHKYQSTLPKNRTKKKNGRPKRSFNPRRWDMVTDLPRNEYIAMQNRKNLERNNYECRNLGNNITFNNTNYYSDDEE